MNYRNSLHSDLTWKELRWIIGLGRNTPIFKSAKQDPAECSDSLSFHFCTMRSRLQNRLLSAGWRHNAVCLAWVWRLRGLPLPLFRALTQRFEGGSACTETGCSTLWDGNSDVECEWLYDRSRPEQQGWHRQACWCSQHITVCLYVRTRPDWNASYGEDGPLIEGFQTPSLINTPSSRVDRFILQTCRHQQHNTERA